MTKEIEVEYEGYTANAVVEYDYLIEEAIPVYSIESFSVEPEPTEDDERYLSISKVLLNMVKEEADKESTWRY